MSSSFTVIQPLEVDKPILNNLIKKNDIGENLMVFAQSENDSTIEGYFHEKLPVLGVMWHPERDKERKYQSKIVNIVYNKTAW